MRFRPRFSVRTLAIFVTLVCAYLACWWPTKTRGLRDVRSYVVGDLIFGWDGDGINEVPMCPLIIQTDEPVLQTHLGMLFTVEPITRRYYFWFFGYVAKLPYEREVATIELQKTPATSAQFFRSR